MRRSPPIIFRSDDDLALEVFETPTTFVVCYKGQPIGVRKAKASGDFHYSKTLFPARAHADRLVDRLNTQFNTDQFSVTTLAFEP